MGEWIYSFEKLMRAKKFWKKDIVSHSKNKQMLCVPYQVKIIPHDNNLKYVKNPPSLRSSSCVVEVDSMWIWENW